MKRLFLLLVLLSYPIFGQDGNPYQILDIRTTGSDTNGIGFEPGIGTKIVNASATLAIDATSCFVVSSSAHTFVSGDVGRWMHLTAGTGWIGDAGVFYQILSVNAGAATLSTWQGCPTYVGNVNLATFNLYYGIAYNKQDAPQWALSNCTSSTLGAFPLTCSGASFAADVSGNWTWLNGGTGGTVTTGWYLCTYLSSTVVNLDRSPGAIATLVTANVGGGGATPGLVTTLFYPYGGTVICQKTGTYTLTTATASVSGGKVVPVAGGEFRWLSYGSDWGDGATGAIIAVPGDGSVTGITVVDFGSLSKTYAYGIGVDGANQIGITGFLIVVGGQILENVTFTRTTVLGIQGTSGTIIDSHGTNCSGTAGISGGGNVISTVVSGCTAPGFYTDTATAYLNDYSLNNSGATTDGFLVASGDGVVVPMIGNVSYGNGRHGINATNQYQLTVFFNNILEANAGYGISAVQDSDHAKFGENNAFYGNALGASNIAGNFTGRIFGSASFFQNAAGGDFRLNQTAGAGALLRGAATPTLVLTPTPTPNYRDIGPVQHADLPVWW